MSVVIELVGNTAKLTASTEAEIDRQYAITGVTSPEAAVIALRDYLLLTVGNPPDLGSLVLDQITDAEQVQDVYFATAMWRTYSRRSKPAEGESQFNIEIGLEPVRVNSAVGGIRAYKSDDVEVWVPQKINDQGNGSDVEGVDIFEPVYEESETHWVPTASLTNAYRDTVSQIVGHVNSDPFKGWQAGEVLMRGVSGSRRGATDTELTFRWSIRRNQSDLTLGDVTGIEKKGWEYLWPRYSTKRQFGNAPSKDVITHVAIATVFPTADFSGLGIGTE